MIKLSLAQVTQFSKVRAVDFNDAPVITNQKKSKLSGEFRRPNLLRVRQLDNQTIGFVLLQSHLPF